MRAQKKKSSSNQLATKICASNEQARDIGPRLLPIRKKAETERESSLKYLELADVALGQKMKHGASAKKKRSA